MITAFDIGGSYIDYAWISCDFSVSAISTSPTPVEDYAEFLIAISARVSPDATAVAVSSAGLVDPDSGMVKAANLPCLKGQLLRSDLEKLTGRPVFLLNDAKAFALAEAHRGAGAGYESVLAIILGTGVGGAIVLGGRLLTGAAMVAGEWGHGPASAMRSGRDLPRWTCGCGQKGCVDLYGGARGLERLHDHLTGKSLTSVDILDAWQAGDAAALETLDLYLDVVGGALANVVNVIDPAVIVAGGGLSRRGALLTALQEEVHARVLAPETAPRIVSAAVPGNSALIGAAVFAAGELDSGDRVV